jgi:Bacterial regulatory helix-turn-helix protein, lysR family
MRRRFDLDASRRSKPGTVEGSLNWDDLRFLLAVARHGSLSAAARHLRTTQPTVGRRIATFEASLGTQNLSPLARIACAH